MAGMLIPVLEKRRIEYSHLGGGASQSITLHPAIEVCGFLYVHLFVRVHERNMVSGQSFSFGLYYTMPSPDDPREFTVATSLTDLSVTSTSPASTPGLVHRETSSPGAFLKLTLTATQASVPSTLYAELSAELMLRES